MMTLEEIFTEYEKGCGNTCLDGKPSDCNECLEAAVRAVNRYQDAELATLRAENERLRDALREVMQTLSWQYFGECRGISDNLLEPSDAVAIAKEALK